MINVGLIPVPDNQEKIYYKQGDTENIISIVLKGCSSDIKKGFNQFCKQFSADEQGLRELWSFVKYRIVYQTDEDGRQDILLPAALWDRGWGDCKSKTVFTVHVLRCLGIPYTVRFTGYSGKSLTHVYCIAHLNGEDIIIDTVFDFFNREKKYKHKKDYYMTKISMISGFENQYQNKVGSTLPMQQESGIGTLKGLLIIGALIVGGIILYRYNEK
jgi:hypothetical protein